MAEAQRESDEPHADVFWDPVAEQGLPYRRRDPVRAVLERGRIRSAAEAELVSDILSDVDCERFDRAELEGLGGSSARTNRRCPGPDMSHPT